MKRFIITLISILIFISISFAQENRPYLDTKTIGSYDMIKKNPSYDGRGVVIFVLDNGVDPAIEGLTKTSTGETKVIDLQDFSGQLELALKLAKKDKFQNTEVLKCGDVSIEGFAALSLKPSNGKYYMAVIDENKHYKNSAVKDLNSNGSTNDKFVILSFEINNADQLLKDANGKVKPQKDMWVYYIDEDADGAIDDEEPKFEYKYNFDTFDFYKGDPSKRPLVTMSASIKDKKIIVHSCDGSHGSHCAGIAAGNDIYGTDGYDGVAPGAYVTSYKIGHNGLSGGATTSESMKKAYEHGIKFMEEAGFKYAVYSMSYGIGSETPGLSEIEKFLDEFAKKHPNIVIVNSNGNNGPGINSTGNPAGANNIISAGAMISPETLKDLYGSARSKHWITHFSSRGGESPKPDVISPGSASSTVPRYETGDRFWGTSMACPQVAGACAVILSAALQENLDVDGGMVKRALKYTAEPIQGYTEISQGNGLAKIGPALEQLRIMAKRGDKGKIFNYELTAPNTFYSSGKGPSAFWKAGNYIPESKVKHNATVKAVFSDDTPKEKQHEFYRSFDLKSSASWLETDKSQLYIRGELPAQIGFTIDKEKIDKPGLHVGRIYAYPDDVKSGGNADFDLQVSVVVPNDLDGNYELYKKDQKLEIGEIGREFVFIPPGASAMDIQIKPSSSKHFGMAAYLYKPDGNASNYINHSDADNNEPLHFNVVGTDLDPGTWEILPYCYYQSQSISYYDMKVKFYGVETNPDVTHEIEYEIGESPEIDVKFINNYPDVLKAKFVGSILGYRISEKYSDENMKKFKKNINVADDISKVVLKIRMDADEFNKHTDLAVNIYDKSGKAVLASGMSRMNETITFKAPLPGQYKLEIVPGFTSKKVKAEEWEFEITEDYHYKSPINLKSEKSNAELLPGVWVDNEFEAQGEFPLAPGRAMTFGEIKIIDTRTGSTAGNHEILIVR